MAYLRRKPVDRVTIGKRARSTTARLPAIAVRTPSFSSTRTITMASRLSSPSGSLVIRVAHGTSLNQDLNAHIFQG